MAGGARLPLSDNAAGRLIAQVFEPRRGTLTPAEAGVLEAAVARAGAPDSMALAGLVLSKLALPVVPDLLRPLAAALGPRAGHGSFALPSQLIELAIEPVAAADRDAAAAAPDAMPAWAALALLMQQQLAPQARGESAPAVALPPPPGPLRQPAAGSGWRPRPGAGPRAASAQRADGRHCFAPRRHACLPGGWPAGGTRRGAVCAGCRP